MRKLILAIIIISSWPGLSHSQIVLGNNTTLEFATVEQGKQILTSRDDFVQRMSPFDRAVRMKTDKVVTEQEFLVFVGNNILEWSEIDREKIITAVQGINDKLKSLALPFPETIMIVKTSGEEEGRAAYTRANAIIFPVNDLNESIDKIQKKISHELFHILTRSNPDLRDKLYKVIGFARCTEIEFPDSLKSRKITNPDAPVNEHCIKIKSGGKEHWAIPILFSKSEKYNKKKGGELFDYLQFQLLLVDRQENSPVFKVMYDGNVPKLASIQQVSGFIEQVGRNTGYIIHPEEILAENFAQWILGQKNLPSPQIIVRISKILTAN